MNTYGKMAICSISDETANDVAMAKMRYERDFWKDAYQRLQKYHQAEMSSHTDSQSKVDHIRVRALIQAIAASSPHLHVHFNEDLSQHSPEHLFSWALRVMNNDVGNNVHSADNDTCRHILDSLKMTLEAHLRDTSKCLEALTEQHINKCTHISKTY